jgi:hypothetical protein
VSKGRFSAVAAAFRDLARACVAIEAAFGDLDAEPAERKPRQKPLPIPAVDAPKSKREASGDLNGTDRKILTALAQQGRALTTSQIGTLAGMSSGTGSFGQALARLRASNYAEGPGTALRITQAGFDVLGPFARLPEGYELFEYWCGKVGGTAAKILRALRASGEDMSSEELGEATMLSHTTGSFGQALAKLRRLELIEGGGDSMVLSDSLLQAIAPTIGVYNTKSGRTHRVRAQ